MGDFSPSLQHDRYFLKWLEDTGVSLLATSYKTNYVFCIGTAYLLEPEVKTQLSFWMSQSPRCMGMTRTDGSNEVWIGNMSFLTKYRKFGPHKDEGEDYKRKPFDALYVPRKVHVTGDVDIHDIVIPSKGPNAGVPHFVSAVYGCVCIPQDNHSFKVIWKPDWLTKIAAEDRTHLNGLTCVDGIPRYVTAISRTDVRGGWREHKKDGGVIYDIVNNKLVSKNLSMPHSPRWHNERLWILNSGKGEFGYIDLSITEEYKEEKYHPFVPKTFIPGYLRGLSFVGNEYAVIGSSDDRHDTTFQGLELGDRLKEKGVSARCGIFVVDLKTFDIIHEITFDKPITELYDVTVLPRTIRPRLDELNAFTVSQRINFVE